MLSGHLPNISSNSYYHGQNNHISQSGFLGRLPSSPHHIPLSPPSHPEKPIFHLIKFNRHHNGEGREHHQINIDGNHHNSFHYENTTYYKINQGQNTYVEKSFLESQFGTKYIPLLSDSRVKSQFESHRSSNFYENNYTTISSPNQFTKPESGNHDPTQHVWGKPSTPIPQYSTIVQPKRNDQIHDRRESESHLQDFKGPTPTKQISFIDLSNDLSNDGSQRSPQSRPTRGSPRSGTFSRKDLERLKRSMSGKHNNI